MKEINKIIEATQGGISIDTQLQVNEIKRGQVLYITAMLKKPQGASYNSQMTMGVIQVRVVDFFYGLSKLKTLKN